MGYTSQAGQLLIVSQPTAGTFNNAIGTDGIAIKLRSGSFAANRELMVPDPEIGGGRDTSDAYLGGVSWSGDFEFYGRTDAIATLLKGVLGVAAAPVTATGVTTHTFTPSDDTMPFFSVEEVIGNGLEAYRYTDVVMNTLHLEADANGYLQGSVSLIARRQIAGVTPTVAPKWDNTPMMVGTNIGITYNGVALPAKSFSLDIANNFEDDDYRLGSFYIGDLTPKSREITASFNIRHVSSAQWRQATYGAPTVTEAGGLTVKAPLVIKASSYETISGSTPATPYSTELTIPKFVLAPFSYEASGDDILENDIEGRGLRPDPSVKILTAVVKTGKATVS